jgi:hypothetical protein
MQRSNTGLLRLVMLTALFTGSIMWSAGCQSDESSNQFERFEFLHIGITRSEVEQELGEPHSDSTTYVSTYPVKNGMELNLRFSGTPRLLGAWVEFSDGQRKDFFTRQVIVSPRLEDFQFLDRGVTTYEEVTERLGEPNAELGSGQHLALYRLTDGREVTLILGTRLVAGETRFTIGDALVGPSADGSHISLFDG